MNHKGIKKRAAMKAAIKMPGKKMSMPGGQRTCHVKAAYIQATRHHSKMTALK
jgi:hypothetical protein